MPPDLVALLGELARRWAMTPQLPSTDITPTSPFRCAWRLRNLWRGSAFLCRVLFLKLRRFVEAFTSNCWTDYYALALRGWDATPQIGSGSRWPQLTQSDLAEDLHLPDFVARNL